MAEWTLKIDHLAQIEFLCLNEPGQMLVRLNAIWNSFHKL